MVDKEKKNICFKEPSRKFNPIWISLLYSSLRTSFWLLFCWKTWHRRFNPLAAVGWQIGPKIQSDRHVWLINRPTRLDCSGTLTLTLCPMKGSKKICSQTVKVPSRITSLLFYDNKIPWQVDPSHRTLWLGSGCSVRSAHTKSSPCDSPPTMK